MEALRIGYYVCTRVDTFSVQNTWITNKHEIAVKPAPTLVEHVSFITGDIFFF